jgi:topoisomerase-4 subunit A
VIDITFAKERGKERRANQIINIEEFIKIKGISAQGNQLSKYKVNQIDLSDSLPYEAPKTIPADDIEVIDEEEVNDDLGKDDQNDINNEGQIKLF